MESLWKPEAKDNVDLVRILKENRTIVSPRVEQVMLLVDRGHYCQKEPYKDSAQPIGFGATISAPHMHALCLEHLEQSCFNGARVLDIGCGSGYLTACFAYLVGNTGLVVGVDHVEELVRLAAINVKKGNIELFGGDRITFVHGDGRQGYPSSAPYDVIHVGAASAKIPEVLLNQLGRNGRMILPVGETGIEQVLEIVYKKPDDTVIREKLMSVMFIPLTEKEKQLGGSKIME